VFPCMGSLFLLEVLITTDHHNYIFKDYI